MSGTPQRVNVVDVDVEHGVAVQVQVTSQTVVCQQTRAVHCGLGDDHYSDD